MSNGEQYANFSLGSFQGTMDGQDVYVLDDSISGFTTSDEMGNFYPDDAIALVDDNGNVVQFVSWEGNTVSATNGPAAGQTSTDSGNITAVGQSMQSDDRGSTYYNQSNPNSGTIPACYAPGTLIKTPYGDRKIETLRVGDEVVSEAGVTHTIRWVWKGHEPLGLVPKQNKPILIKKHALGRSCPSEDLIVSGQHRVVAGGANQLLDAFEMPCLVPAKALTQMPKIRYMTGKRDITWHHILCDTHQLIAANGVVSETLLLGPEIANSLSPQQRREIGSALGMRVTGKTDFQPALPCHPVKHAKARLDTFKKSKNQLNIVRHHNPDLDSNLKAAETSVLAA